MLIVALLGLVACASAPEEEAVPRREIAWSFEGLETFGEGELLDAAAEQLDAFTVEGAGLSELADAVYAMESRLEANGYWRAWIEFEVRPSEADPREVHFMVHEGPKAILKRLRIEGNVAFDNQSLKDFVIPKGSIFGGADDTFRQREIESGVGRIRDHYLVQGYQDVGVELEGITWNRERTEAVAVIKVVEGPQHVVDSIEIVGDLAPDDPLRRAVLDEHRGEAFRISRPSEMAAFIRRGLSARGFLDAEVASEVSGEDSPEREVTLTVRRGPEVHLGELSFSGEDRTSRSFIEGLLRLEPGQRLDTEAMDATLDRLYGTGLFGSVELDVAPPASGEDEAETRTADLAIELAEIPARNVDFEIGWGSYELARSVIRYRDNNLFGIGRQLQVDLNGSVKAYGIETRIIDPYILGDKDQLELGAGFDFRKEPVFDRTRYFWDLTWRHNYSDREDIRFGYRFNAGQSENLDVEEFNGEEDDFLIEAGLFLLYRRDGRDQWIAPTSGYLLETGLFWSDSPFGADLEYLRLALSFSWYHELFEGTVLALGTRMTTLHILNNDENLPIQTRLFLGGESNIRSFREDELGPVDDDDDPLGGLTSFEAHVELRQQLFGQLYGSLFFDVGTIGDDSFDFSEPYGYAVGAGLSYLLPFGPIRLDFGYNPGKRFAADDDWALHFAFGFAF